MIQRAAPLYPALPIDAVMAELTEALRKNSAAVLQAPPGAGKTTRVPLALMAEAWAEGRTILMLEPRRIAARAAAERMSDQLGQKVGDEIGYRIKGESRTSPGTRVEVVTEGVLTRRLQSDPELSGVAAVIFDEFHERSIHADLGLALCLEAQGALREDLRLLVMSATMDGGPVADLLGGAPVVTSQGRAYPVETRWLDKPWTRPGPRGPRLEDAVADLTLQAIAADPGDALVFLPGAAEIRRVEARLSSAVSTTVDIRPIYGDLPAAAQRLALAPSPDGRRKIVLATAIAETSLTFDGVRIVVDAGRARRAAFDPGSGMSRLVTERVSIAAADQRRGRAGRTAPGSCWRMWTRGEEGALPAYAPPEIMSADLTALALELAIWGVADPASMAFLNPPPGPALTQARDLLTQLGALDAQGRATDHGRKLAGMPVHPRLGHMLTQGRATGQGDLAAELAALLGERDPLRVPSAPRPGIDMRLRVEALRRPDRSPSDPNVIKRIKREVRRLSEKGAARPTASAATGALLAHAYPDRIGMRRKGEAPRYLLSGGKGAIAPSDDPLAGEALVVAVELDGDKREAAIRLAAPIDRRDVEMIFRGQIEEQSVCKWSRRDNMVVAVTRQMLGALALEEHPWKNAPPDAVAEAMTTGIQRLGLAALPWSAAARRLQARVQWLHDRAPDAAPDWSDEALLATARDWLTPHLGDARRAADLERLDLAGILRNALDWETLQRLDRDAPGKYRAPNGVEVPVDYGRAQPTISIRPQALYGLKDHPLIGPDRAPLTIELLSPANRPIQTTADLPGFWRGAWADARKDMRSRYPKHDWPEDPASAQPSRPRRR